MFWFYLRDLREDRPHFLDHLFSENDFVFLIDAAPELSINSKRLEDFRSGNKRHYCPLQIPLLVEVLVAFEPTPGSF